MRKLDDQAHDATVLFSQLRGDEIGIVIVAENASKTEQTAFRLRSPNQGALEERLNWFTGGSATIFAAAADDFEKYGPVTRLTGSDRITT